MDPAAQASQGGWPSLPTAWGDTVNSWAFEAIGVGPDDYLTGGIPGAPSLGPSRMPQDMAVPQASAPGMVPPSDPSRQSLFSEMFTSRSGSGFGFGDDVFDGECW